MSTYDELRYPERAAQREMRAVTESRIRREAEDQEMLNAYLRKQDAKKEIQQ